MPPTGGLAHSPDIALLGIELATFGAQAGAQSTDSQGYLNFILIYSATPILRQMGCFQGIYNEHTHICKQSYRVGPQKCGGLIEVSGHFQFG